MRGLYSNVQSFVNKKAEIERYLNENETDLLFFTECWIHEDHAAGEISIPGYQIPVVFERDRGGACIFVRNGIKFFEVKSPHNSSDAVWIVIQTGNRVDRIYGCIYRSPNASMENNSALFEDIRWAKRNYKEICLVGDFNFPSIDWFSYEGGTSTEISFIELLLDLGLYQSVDEATRFRDGQTPSLLDLIVTSEENLVKNIALGCPFGKSDHVTIRFDIVNAYVAESCGNGLKYNFKKLNYNAFAADMTCIEWVEIFTYESDLNYSFEYFITVVGHLIEKHAPKFPHRKIIRAPWSTRYIGKLSKIKRKKWDRYKFTRRRYDYEQYRTALSRFNTEKEEAIRRYEGNIIANKKTCPKKYYEYVGSKDKYSEAKISLKCDSNVITDDKQCAQKFNDFFTSVFTQGSANMAEYESDDFVQIQSMEEVEINEGLIREEILKLDPNKASGPDEIPARLLISAVDVFVPILTKVLQISFEKSLVPNILKSGNIIPIHKSGDKTQTGNYRPVSLTPIIAKLFERVVKIGLERHINRYSIIADSQHGFQKNRSTSTNMVSFWNQITNNIDKTASISILYTDLSKAFDSVPHDLLIMKLKRCGIDGKTGAWIENFLNQRTQRVRIGAQLSETRTVLSEVPQGGVLSGILFSLYINDLPNCLNFGQISMYADDTKIFAPIKSNYDVVLFQDDINSLTSWCRKWKLKLNAGKCHLLQYNPRSEARKFEPIYHIDDVPVDRKNSVKDLGVIIADDAKFHKQVNVACTRATREINRIRRSFSTRTPKFLAEMYKLYVRPHMEYCIELWNPVYEGDKMKMEKTQNRMTKLLRHGRVLTPAERNSVLGLTTHEERRKRGDMISTFKHIDNPDLFTLKLDSRTRGNDKTVIARNYRHDVKRHSFNARVITDWNKLPNYVVNSQDVNSFKTNYDNFLSIRNT